MLTKHKGKKREPLNGPSGPRRDPPAPFRAHFYQYTPHKRLPLNVTIDNRTQFFYALSAMKAYWRNDE